MMLRRPLLLAALTLGAAGAVSEAKAQYFGRNRVQYGTFDFQVLRTEHFDVYFYAAESTAAREAGRMAERWYTRLTALFGDSLNGRQPLILYASPVQFQQTNAVSGDIGEGTGGVTESFKRRIVLPFSVSLAETDHVIGHELVHAFQFDLISRGRGRFLPLWFMEGMAEYLSLGPVDAHTAMWLRDAVLHDDLPRVRDLNNLKYFPYRYGHAFWAYVGTRWSDELIGPLLRSASRSGDPEQAIRAVLRMEPDSLSREWHAALRAAWPELGGAAEGGAGRQATAPREAAVAGAARPLLTKRTTGGEISLAPALSPDGSRVVFLSERGRFSIDMFLADANTGRVQRRITHTALDGHLESLQFIHSAGSWHPDGRRFAFAGIVGGRAALVIMDLDRGRREREITLRGVDEALGPSWSPDGTRLVFTGQTGGVTDLYVYDLESDELRRLTNDVYADLQPAWSPDGRTIAFTTDRFDTDLRTLSYGRYRVALLDAEGGRVRPAPGAPGGKAINPQWSADGRSLFFVADPDGVSNVYRLEVASGELYRLTNLETGASGITALSPAIGSALGADRLAVSVYRNGGYEVITLEGETALAGRSAGQPAPARRVAALPVHSSGGVVAAYLEDHAGGLPADTSFGIRPYSASLSLDYVSQPYLAVGSDRYGTFIGGGASLYWSSMLGNHQLTTGLQSYGGFKDIAAQVGYANLTHRLDWGVVASQIPYRWSSYSNTLENVGGQPTLVYRELRQRQTSRQVAGLAAYPFSRVQRFELAAGIQQISFDNEIRTLGFDPATGQLLFDTDSSLSAPGGLVLGQASAAMVFDNSIFGGTGPVAGRRWRLEAAPTVGSLSYLTALADGRQYLPVGPFTLAMRGMHFGRYGGGAEDSRLSPLFLGYQALVRGYDNGSFSARECVPDATSDCPVFDRLLGTRVLVGNVELRLPLLGPLGVLSSGGFPPLDVALFADGGVAWTAAESPSMFNGSRSGVGSIGAALRFNLFGFAILELDYVKPLNRPDKGAYLQFGFNPGF